MTAVQPRPLSWSRAVAALLAALAVTGSAPAAAVLVARPVGGR